MCLFGTITKSLTDMRKCRNWQTSKTKDLVIIAIVWVQVPSPAFVKQKGSSNTDEPFLFSRFQKEEQKKSSLSSTFHLSLNYRCYLQELFSHLPVPFLS